MLLHTILDMVFPARCLSCGSSGSYFCPKCLSSCRTAERECAEWIFPVFDYRDPRIKKAVWILKYKGRKKLGEVFAGVLYGRIIEELADLERMENFTNPLLMPIPLSGRRLRERGFNQSTLLCEEIMKADLGEHLTSAKNILEKIKETEHQARIKERGARLKNLSGSFRIKNAESVEGKNIILVDDVITTGATLSEARKTLKLSGARKVIAFTIAH